MDFIKKTALSDLKFIAIQLLYIMTFGLASFSKWAESEVPDHFIERFSGSMFDLFSGSLIVAFYTIAVSETIIFVLFLISVAKMEWLKEKRKVFMETGLVVSLFVFFLIGFGLRATADFDGAAKLFFYFGVTLVALFIVEKAKTK